MNKTFVRVMLVLICAGSLASCKIFRKTTHKKIFTDTTSVGRIPSTTDSSAVHVVADSTLNTGTPLAIMTPEKQALADSIQQVWQQKVSYTTFSGKAKMHYEGKGQSVEFMANIRMKKDSVIWVSITATVLSMQVARVYITPDSIKLVNYLQKEVMQMPFSDANKLLPASVDFASLQNLIAGNALHEGGKLTDITSFGGTWSVQLNDSQYIQQLTYNKADSTMRSSQMKTMQPASPQMMIQYGNYEQVHGQRFANSRSINIANGNDQYLIDMNFSNAVFDEPVDLPFSIPKKYTMK
ncbi:DUF4292 domain-containing protein [Chitinophagaceae bacterium MMS25-I14]